ncbi:hypothetical protein ACLQ2N_16270 [Streptomyces sp. DT224]|uniref:hypothetical protein n=1 Tax=Streptomyces sp. DT224 TaxID=3393426 RepID=UPI003CF38D33
MSVIDTYVSCTGSEFYPARLDPTGPRWNGFVTPVFTLDTTRQIAADTQAAAEKNGHQCTDTIHVTDGGVTDDGQPQALVMRISWLLLAENDATAVQIIEPDAEGMYAIGGFEWSWYQVDDGPLATAHDAAWKARDRALKESVRRAGELLREDVPDVTAAGVIVEDGIPRLISVATLREIIWKEDGDGESLLGDDAIGDATDVLREALEFGRSPEVLQSSGWKRLDNTEGIDAYTIKFPAPVPSQVRRAVLPPFPQQAS